MESLGPTVERETQPADVFDGELNDAYDQWLEVKKKLMAHGSFRKEDSGVYFEIEETLTELPCVKIAWPKEGADTYMLTLYPNQGKNNGYYGVYGVARKNEEGKYEYSPDKDPTRLEELLQTPDDIKLKVYPTETIWAVDRKNKEEDNGSGGETNFYMGLGFLMCGPEWMLVAMHEVGHLPDEEDERKAWRQAKINLARMLKNKKNPNFGLLKKPRKDQLTIGKIEKYGLLTHWVNSRNKKKVPIPQRWEADTNEVLDEFKKRIVAATRAYQKFTTRE